MAKISTKNIAEAIYEMAKGKTGVDLGTQLVKVKDYLVRKRLLPKAPEILRKLSEIINKAEGVVEADVIYNKVPAKHVSTEIGKLLKQRYQAKTVVLKIKENKSLLGGVKIQAQGEVIDFSLRNKLNQLQDYLITN